MQKNICWIAYLSMMLKITTSIEPNLAALPAEHLTVELWLAKLQKKTKTKDKLKITNKHANTANAKAIRDCLL